MKKFIIGGLVLFLFSMSLFSYEYVMNDNVIFTTGIVSTQITTLTGGNWENGYYDMTLPANNQFYFYGKKVTHLRIWTKGYVTFGYGAPSGIGIYYNDRIPDSTGPNSYAAPWWDDWDLRGSGSIWYTIGTYGPGSHNWVCIEWRDVAHYYDATASYNFQVLFFAEYHGGDTLARKDSIIFNYMDTDSGTGAYDFGKSGTVGIEHHTGWQGEQYSYNTASLNNTLQIMFTPFVSTYGSTDFNADGYGDLTIFRPSNGYWYKQYNENGTPGSHSYKWGQNGDVAVPGDYDGDTDADECVFRPCNGTWYCAAPSFSIAFGQEGDIPVPADYNGDGKTEIAVYRPSNGRWYVRWWTGGYSTYSWGQQGDMPFSGDSDGDGTDDKMVWRPSNQMFYVWYSGGGTNSQQGGMDGDIPVPATWSGGLYSPGIFRPSNGNWHTSVWGGSYSTWPWGMDGDFPMAADYVGSGYSWFMVFRASNGTWYQKQSSTTNSYSWGMAGDKARIKRSSTINAPNPGVGGPAIKN